MSRILIIEDETDQAELFRMALEGAGMEVIGTTDDLRETETAPAGEPDLVILDERLGGRSGVALIPRLRIAYPKTQMLILTADPDVAETAVERGADEGKMKPLPLVQLISSVRALLARRA